MPIVLFDIDDTLIRSQAIDGELYVASLQAVFGFRNINADWSSYVHTSDTGILDEICRQRLRRPPTADEAQAFRSHFVEAVRAHAAHSPFVEIPGAGALLRHLQDAGLSVGLATGGYADSARCKLNSAGVDVTDIPLASADDAHARTDIMKTAVQRIVGTAPASALPPVVYFGDAIWDARACRKLGMPFIGVGSGERATLLRSEGARIVFETLERHEDVVAAIRSAVAC
jgi:phosphoglycolate phosphatase-like HAD superfamily hydrolase